jgi:O-antigen ligase
MFFEHPLLGTGTAGFEAVARTAPTIGGREYPHNLVLQVASEFGVLGLVLFGALGILALFWWRPRTTVAAALAALAASLLLNAMVSNGLYENRMLWGVWLVALAYSAADQRTTPVEEPLAR